VSDLFLKTPEEQYEALERQYEKAVVMLRAVKGYGKMLARSGNPKVAAIGKDIADITNVKNYAE
jgi:hypothetical protein